MRVEQPFFLICMLCVLSQETNSVAQLFMQSAFLIVCQTTSELRVVFIFFSQVSNVVSATQRLTGL